MSVNAQACPMLEKIGLLGVEGVKIADLAKTERIICEMIQGSFKNLQLVIDYDNTLTKSHHNGIRCESSWGVLENSKLMSEEHRIEALNMFNKYQPIEVDCSLTEAEKIPSMIEWYNNIGAVFKTCKIQKAALKEVVQESNIRIRDGAPELMKLMEKNVVPVLVLSAGMGDVLERALERFNVYTENVKVIANFFKYNDEDVMVGMEGTVIHVFNKNENVVHSSGYFQKLKDRANVLLLGDSLGDVKMAAGAPENSNVLKIGFLNDKIDLNLDAFMKVYDIVLLNDQTMNIPNRIFAVFEK